MPVPTFSPADVAWIRSRLDWLAMRPYNVARLERGEGGGDFGLLCDIRDATLFGLSLDDQYSVTDPTWRQYSGAWLYSTLPFTLVFERALQMAEGGGVEALKERWRLGALQRRAEREQGHAERKKRRAQLKFALEGVSVDLDEFTSSAEEEWWSQDDFSFAFGRVTTSRAEARRLGRMKWQCRNLVPVSECFKAVHRALLALGMGQGRMGCQCAGQSSCHVRRR